MGEGGTEGLPFWLKESSSTCNEQFFQPERQEISDFECCCQSSKDSLALWVQW